MAKSKQTKKFRIATLFLALAMVLAFCSFFLAACTSGSNTDENEDSAATPTDTQTFANANFEYFSDSDGDYLIADAQSWTAANVSNANGTSASSSISRSGIVDTSFDWSKFVEAYETYKRYDDSDEDPSEDENYYSDIDNYYDIPGWDVVKTALKKEGSSDDISKDETFTAHRAEIAEAAKALNPLTHDYAEGSENEQSHVLMLHNYRTDGYGTARQYTSQTITLSAGSAAKVSVWVKTAEMTYGDGRTANGDHGAFIQITNTVGGSSRDPLVVKNIDTSSAADNDTNGWVQYTFYIKASAYSSTTFAVVLGLGRQTDKVAESNVNEYVQGYAFFDDLTYEVMTAAEYNTAVQAASVKKFALDLNNIDDPWSKLVSAGSDTAFALDLDELGIFADSTTYFTDLSLGGTLAKTTDDFGRTYERYFKTSNFEEDSKFGGEVKASSVATKWPGRPIVDKFAKFANGELPFGGNDPSMIFLYSSDGAPQTYTLSQQFSLAKDSNLIITFWVKTSSMNGGTGATATIVDEANNKTTIGAVDTTTLDSVDLSDDAHKQEDIFDGWQQCFFFITNDTDDTVDFEVQFSFGLTTLTATKSDYISGWAAFAGLRSSTTELTDAQFAAKTTGTYAVDVSLTADTQSAESSFDDEAFTDRDTIKTDVADPRNYDGVYGNSSYVGGTDVSTGKNELATAGLINKDYADAYQSKLSTWFPTIASALDPDNWWNSLIGDDCTQPLFISNTLTEAAAYGFVAKASTNIASSGYALVSVRVKLSKDATANIYLIDTTQPDTDSGKKQYSDTLAYTSGISYRYDENGNVVNLDPKDKAFNEDVNTVFYKQSNGLWFTSASFSGDVYYANLQNFEEYNAENKAEDLLNSSGSVAYYAHDGEYYRYYDADTQTYSVKVRDFSEAGVADEKMAGAVLQQKSEGNLLSRTVTYSPDDANAPEMSDWIYVRFFIKAGDTAKDYRLEVWSGSRDGVTKNETGSLVIFDKVSYSALTEDTFSSYSSEALDDYAAAVLGAGNTAEELEKDYQKDPAAYMAGKTEDSSLVYFHYSLYDDIDYASYDPDRSSESDSYASYAPDTYSNQLAYLRYSFTEGATTYYDTIVDYSSSEITVATSSDDTTDDDTTETPATGGDQNVWLLITSIVLAAALVFTMLALLLRKLLSNMKKKSVRTKPMYDNKRKRYIRKLRLEESEKDENADDVLPDEDEFTEEDIYGTNQEDKARELEEDDKQADQPEDGDSQNKE